MTFPKPFNVWQWLALLSPGVVMIFCGMILPILLNAISGGGDDKFTQLSFGLDGIMVAAVLSLILGFWRAWEAQNLLLERCVFGLVYAIGIAFVNLAVAYAGCSAPFILDRVLSR